MTAMTCESSSSVVRLTYGCCGAEYAVDLCTLPPRSSAWHTIPITDARHAAEHPECPPLDEPLECFQ